MWQNRPHDGLRDPLHPALAVSPNQKYAALIETAGYVPVPLSAEDHIELLPAVWRAVNAYGIKISHRTYDSAGLNPIRQQPSGVKDGRWEVHYDPYDVSKVFVRGPGGWITCTWKYLDRVPVPFGELAWHHISGQLAGQGRGDASELERAQAVDELLRRAYHGPPADTPEAAGAPAGDANAETARTRPRSRGGKKPPARDWRVAAATRATAARDSSGTTEPAASPAAATPAGDDNDARTPPDDDQPVAKVIPLGIFDPFEEARKQW